MPAQRVHISVNRIIPFEDMKLIMRGFITGAKIESDAHHTS